MARRHRIHLRPEAGVDLEVDLVKMDAGVDVDADAVVDAVVDAEVEAEVEAGVEAECLDAEARCKGKWQGKFRW